MDCSSCKYSNIAEDTWAGDIISYWCDKNHSEYEVCDVGYVSPTYTCEDYKNKENR